MKGIILQLLYASKRDFVFIGTTCLVVVISMFSYFLGSMALVEQNEAKIIYTAGISRISVIFGVIIFGIFYIRRLFENREMEMLLSHSISRTKIVISFFIGFALIFLALLFPIFLILLLLNTSFLSILYWCSSVYFEGLTMIGFLLCCALMIKSQTISLLSCVCMYIVGRTIGNFVAYIELSFQASLMSIFASILKVVSLVIPRFDLFGKTSWLVYNNYSMNDICLCLFQSFIFCGIFLSMVIFDFKRKEF